MLRVTIELVPYGVEEMAKTISELCIANTEQHEDNTANYTAAGYLVRTDNKIEEFTLLLNYFQRDDGVLELLKQLLSQEKQELDSTKMSEVLIQKTRLASQEEDKNESK